MGGDDQSSSGGSSTSEGESSVEQETQKLLPQIPFRLRYDDNGAATDDHVLAYEEFNFGGVDLTLRSSSDFDVNWRRRESAYQEILKSYNLHVSSESLAQAKNKVLSYYPGTWIEEVGGTKSSEYLVPSTTCLILIGPKGSGKSSLINRISKVFEDDKSACLRAQETFNTSKGDGTYFLREYMIPRTSTSFCIYDTRSLSSGPSENSHMIKRWMIKGVRHGEFVTRDSDDSDMRKRMKYKARWKGHPSSALKTVNFAIFVVDGPSVLNSMEGKDDEESSYMDSVSTTYNLPYLSFKDDKPVVVVTHGDLLSVIDRARVRLHLGERLCIPPAKQIFDIPESSDPLTQLAIIDMIRYSLEHADGNLPSNRMLFSKKVCRASTTLRILYFTTVAVLAIILAYWYRPHRHRPKSHLHIDWPSIRHLWLG